MRECLGAPVAPVASNRLPCPGSLQHVELVHCCTCQVECITGLSNPLQVAYTVYDAAMLQPLLDAVNEEKAKADAEEA